MERVTSLKGTGRVDQWCGCERPVSYELDLWSDGEDFDLTGWVELPEGLGQQLQSSARISLQLASGTLLHLVPTSLDRVARKAWVCSVKTLPDPLGWRSRGGPWSVC